MYTYRHTRIHTSMCVYAYIIHIMMIITNIITHNQHDKHN